MIAYLIIFVIGLGFGALFFRQFIRMKYGKPYSKLIEEDFEMQWNMILQSAVVSSMSPFSETIQKISPQFCKIYGEASVAERGNLTQICGISYGKALEFLIKDYAKLENPTLESDIESSHLSACIRKYIHDDLIKNSAELATWLRNDETHYIRKHTDKDVNDLKQLIIYTVALMEEAERRKRFSTSIDKFREDMTSSSTN